MLFVSAAAFDGVGPFDLAFAPGYYEEVDLCFRLHDAGFKIYYDPNVICYHFE